jgi:hypothetical protein
MKGQYLMKINKSKSIPMETARILLANPQRDRLLSSQRIPQIQALTSFSSSLLQSL